MVESFFSKQIPPAWMAFPYLEKYASRALTGNDFSKSVDPSSWDNTYKSKITDYVKFHLTRKDLKYTLNSLGYREQEYQQSYHSYDHLVLAYGHSAVFGVGVSDDHCWPKLLEKRLPNTRVLNFGIPGASTDTVARLVSCTVPYFHSLCKRLSIAVLWPQENRREIFQENYSASWSPWKKPPFPEYVLSIDDRSNRYNFEKNRLIVDTICKIHNINMHTIPYDLYSNLCVNDLDPDEQGHRAMYLSIVGDFK